MRFMNCYSRMNLSYLLEKSVMTNDPRDTGSINEELEQLIEPARLGDKTARERMAELLRPGLRNFAEIIFPNAVKRRADPSDVTQEALIEIDDSIEGFRGSAARELWAWARWKVRAKTKDLYEKHVEAGKRSVNHEVSFSDAVYVEGSDSSPSASAQSREYFARKIEGLPEEERLLMALFYLDGCTPVRAAEALSWTVERVERIRIKAMRRLRQIMEVEGKIGVRQK